MRIVEIAFFRFKLNGWAEKYAHRGNHAVYRQVYMGIANAFYKYQISIAERQHALNSPQKYQERRSSAARTGA